MDQVRPAQTGAEIGLESPPQQVPADGFKQPDAPLESKEGSGDGPGQHEIPGLAEEPTQAPASQSRSLGFIELPPGGVVVEGIRFVPAGLRARILAFLLDSLILALLHQALLEICKVGQPEPSELLGAIGKLLDVMAQGALPDRSALAQLEAHRRPFLLAGWLNMGLCAAYFTTFHGLLGTSLGKGILGLSVLTRQGKAVGVWQAGLRYLAYLLTSKLAYSAWLIPFDPERRTLHDMATNTNVFKADAGYTRRQVRA